MFKIYIIPEAVHIVTMYTIWGFLEKLMFAPRLLVEYSVVKMYPKLGCVDRRKPCFLFRVGVTCRSMYR